MNHFKLVHGTTAPTRYTKIVFVPGKDTKFVKQYQETEYVSRYTKLAAPPASWTPPTPPAEPLAVADGKGSNWVGTNVYEIGQVVEGRTAEFVGGVEPVTYRYRFQTKATGSDTWVNQSWTDTTNEKNPVYFEITEAGQLKLQSQARDSSDPIIQLNSITGIKSCVEPAVIGNVTATVFGNPYDLSAGTALTVLVQDPIPVAVQISGTASVTYNWSVRGDAAAEFSNPIGASTDVTIATAGVVTVQCVIQSVDDLKQADIQFYTVASMSVANPEAY